MNRYKARQGVAATRGVRSYPSHTWACGVLRYDAVQVMGRIDTSMEHTTMKQHVCPWWGGYFIDNRFRRLLHNPKKILGDYLEEGMTVLDFGCGMGFFSIGMAKMVGPSGRVISVDLQPQMLRTLQSRAERAGVAERLQTHACEADTIGVHDPVDFILAFWAAHEAPDTRHLFEEFHLCLKPDGKFLLVEPRGHVTQAHFDEMRRIAADVGFDEVEAPEVRLSHATLFERLQSE